MDTIGLVLLLVLVASLPATLVAWILVNRMQSTLGEGTFWQTLGDLVLRDAPGLIRSVSEVSHRIELRLHNQAVTIEGRGTSVQAITIRAHPQDCDRLEASLDLPHLLHTYGSQYLRNAISEGWQVITAKVTITLVADDRRRRGWPRVLSGRAAAGDQIVAVATVTLNGDERRAAERDANRPSGPQVFGDPGQTRPYPAPTLPQPHVPASERAAAHDSSCPVEHPAALVDDKGHTSQLSGPAVMGRSRTATVRTSDPAISRQHARLEHDQDGWWIMPLSPNGTRVDGVACTTRTRLGSGALIELSRGARWTFTTNCPKTSTMPATLKLA